MTEMEYNQAEGIRRSDLWKMNDSPEKFRYFLENPIEQTPAMAFGSACHKYILEGEDFWNEYAVAPNVDRRTKDGKAAWEAFMAENAGKTPIGQDKIDIMEEMKQALMACPLAKKLMFGEHQTEVPLMWTDPETGEKCKAKLDILINKEFEYTIVDYKTTAHAETEQFNRSIFSFGYYFQAGFYSEGLEHIIDMAKPVRFVFVAQEKDAPYAVNVIEVSEDVMKVGVAKFHELLEKYHECKMVDIWSGYVDDVPNETSLPGWFEMENEEE